LESTVAVSELVSRSVSGGQKAYSGGGRSLFTRIRRCSVRTQLLLVLIALTAAAWLIGGAVTILHARKATRIEIDAAMELAEALCRDAIPIVQQSTSPGRALASIPAQVGRLRHVRLSVTNAAGDVITPAPRISHQNGEARPPAPAWFAAWIAPPADRRELPVVAGGQRLGSIVLASAPGDEIAEVWENATALAEVALAIGVAGIFILHLLFGRVLAPLKSLAEGLLDLGRSDYAVRIEPPQAEELAVIAERFNALAEALDAMKVENRRLSTRLITAQDDERRQTAFNLHDEVAPYLFGLKANATSIANGAKGTAAETRAREMLTMIAGLQAMNRSILNRLRPMALGQVPLGDLLSALVDERARQHPALSIGFSAEGLHPSYGESIDLTLYRCVQESLTNVVRHADAQQVRVTLTHMSSSDDAGHGSPRLILVVADDGHGIKSGQPQGLGIQGMRERVQALGGECRWQADGGTTVRIEIPVPDAIVTQSASSTALR
jgi:two-component system sensor histidine kinase UhpB